MSTTSWKAKSVKGQFVVNNVNLLKQDVRENPGARYDIIKQTPESKNQRGFYHGGVLVLWAYLNGWDYKDNSTLAFLHDKAKEEFNGEMVILDGKKVIKGKSTKGRLSEHLEDVISYLEDEYAVDRKKVLDVKQYKHWRDAIYPFGGADTYIEYLIEIKKLK